MTGETFLIWLGRGVVTVVVGACAALFIRLRKAEERAGRTDERLKSLEGRDADATLAGRLNAVERDQADHDKRIAVMAAELEAAPGHEDLQRLHDRISKIGDQQSEMGRDIATALEGIRGIRTAVDRLHDHHLTGEARA